MNSHLSCLGVTLVLGLAIGTMSPSSAQETHQHHDPASEPCASYSQDVTDDIAVLSGDREPLAAAASPSAAPVMGVNRPYALSLHPQEQATFGVAPSRVMLADGAFAGHVAFQVPATGSYRISLTDETWVDVIDRDQYLDAEAFSGRAGCKPLRKLVDYHLTAGTSYLLLLSGGTEATMGVAIRPLQASDAR